MRPQGWHLDRVSGTRGTFSASCSEAGKELILRAPSSQRSIISPPQARQEARIQEIDSLLLSVKVSIITLSFPMVLGCSSLLHEEVSEEAPAPLPRTHPVAGL